MDREKLERLARERLVDIPLPASDWPILVPQIERVLAIVAELGRFPFEETEPAPIYSASGPGPADAAAPSASRRARQRRAR
jgi:hypothetical protein